MRLITYVGGSRDGLSHEYEEDEIVPRLTMQSYDVPVVVPTPAGVSIFFAVERYMLTAEGGKFTYIHAP